MNKYEEAAKKRAEEKREARNKARDEAQKFVDAFKAENGNKGYISLRIRDGYIGKELDASGRKLQTERARPRGTLVAIKGKEGKVYIGATYKSNKDEDIPIVGIAEALRNAINSKNNDQNTLDVKAKDVDLVKFFNIRAKCFFYPEIFSHSRGVEKLTYPNYDKIHYLRNKVLETYDKQVN